MSETQSNPRSGGFASTSSGMKQNSKGLADPSVPDIKDYIFSYGKQGQADRYNQSVEGLAEALGKVHGRNVSNLFLLRKEPTFKAPDRPTAKRGQEIDPIDMEEFKIRLKEHLDEVRKFQRLKETLFMTIVGQCTKAMKNKLKSLPKFKELEEKEDVVGLLNLLKDLVYSTDGEGQYEFWTMQQTTRTLYGIRQGTTESLTDYQTRFNEQLAVTEEVYGSLTPMKYKDESTGKQEEARDAYLACVYLGGTDRNRHKQAIDSLNNDFLLGRTSYPKNVPAMVTYLTNRRGQGGGANKKVEEIQDGVAQAMTSFMQQAKPKKKMSAAKLAKIRCHICRELGHMRNDCPQQKKGSSNAQVQVDQEEGSDGVGATSFSSSGSRRRPFSGFQRGFFQGPLGPDGKIG